MWGPHGHAASPNWRKIKGWWIKWIRVILSTNGNWTCGNEGDTRGINKGEKNNSLLILELNPAVGWVGGGGGGGGGGERRKSNSREKKFDFSLDFLVFGPSNFIGPRSKVFLRGKGYAWAPVLGSFDKL